MESEHLSKKMFSLEKFPLAIFPINNHWSGQKHSHDFYELVIVLEGMGLHCSETKDTPLMRGSFLVVPPGVEHDYSKVKSLRLVNILFCPDKLSLSADIFDTDKELKEKIKVFQIDNAKVVKIEELLMRLADELKNKQLFFQNVAIGLFIQLRALLLRYTENNKANRMSNSKIAEKAYSFLLKKHASRISLKSLPRQFGVSSATLNRYFHQTYNCSTQKMLLLIRLSTACSLLRKTDLPIAEIASLAGFNDSNYFTPKKIVFICAFFFPASYYDFGFAEMWYISYFQQGKYGYRKFQ
jgi:AraC-like DNA-binding protein/quercetin dioxygenase-like cupin family protein